MRRDTFLKSMAALAAAAALPLPAFAATGVKMMIPANPGGGWDTTGRALGKALQESGAASTVTYDNKGGAAGALGLAQFVNGSKGDGNAMMVMGAVMLGGLITGKPPVSLSQATPIARLSSEYNVFVLPANSPFKTMKDVIEQLKKDPGSVKWGGGSRGSTEHIAAAMIAREVGVDPSKINYVAFRGGGEATAAEGDVVDLAGVDAHGAGDHRRGDVLGRAARTAAPLHAARVFLELCHHVRHRFERRVGGQHKDVEFAGQARNRRGL